MKKKWLLSVVCLGLTLLITACNLPNPNVGKTYQITYYVENEVVEHKPSEYVAGEGVELLPYLEVSDVYIGGTFSGWYDNPEYVGEVITSISKTTFGDKTFYGKWETTSTPTVYQISYVLNGGILPPESVKEYTSLEGVSLLPIPTKEGYRFDGWEKDGNIWNQIPVGTTGNLTFTALWTKNSSTVDELKEAVLAMNNYQYVFAYSCTDGLDDYFCTYEYSEDILKSTYLDPYDGQPYTEYLAYIDSLYYYYGQDEDGSYYRIDENDPYFYLSIQYLDILDLESIDSRLFVLNDGYYELKDQTKVHEVASLILGEYEDEVYTSFQIKVTNQKIVEILATSVFTYDQEEYIYNYTVTFSNHGNIEVTLPEVEDTPTPDVISIEEVYQEVDNQTVTTVGYVTGVVGNNIYIQDETGGLYLYFGGSNEILDELGIGTKLIVTGTKVTFKNLVELSPIIEVQILPETEEIHGIELEDLSTATLTNHVSCLVSYSNAEIVSLPTSWSLSNKDYSLTIRDGVNETTLFLSKYLSTEQKNTLFAFLQTKKVGDTICIENACVSCFNTYQLAVTDTTKITAGGPQTVVETSIEASIQKVKVPLYTSFEDIIQELVVTVYFSDTTSFIVTSDDYQLKHSYNDQKEDTYLVQVIYKNLQTTFTIVVGSPSPFQPEEGSVDLLEDVLSSMGKDPDTGEVYGVNRGLPAIGNPKILVIPVAFTDYAAKPNMVENLNKVLFGTSDETGWESLTSYYYQSSYGKLNITGTVLPVFQTGKSSTYYDSFYDGDYEILQAALEYYDSQIDYSEYDSDDDGYIDAIYLVYSCPISEEEDSMWWAYTSEYFTEDYEYYDQVEADFYLLAGYDFIFEELASPTKISYNAETFIHETGHLLGLDDYYDTDGSKGPAGGIGGGDMMDYNVGDHNAFSKMILGWTTPTIMNGDQATFTLQSFGSSGDCVLIPKGWNGTYFDEYYIIDFYTPDGLNEAEAGASGLFGTSGIRIYHIDATLNSDSTEVWSIWDIYQFNNSDTSHKLISLVEADKGNDIIGTTPEGGWSEDSDLFQENDSYLFDNWYDGTKPNFALTVISISNGEAVIQITSTNNQKA